MEVIVCARLHQTPGPQVIADKQHAADGNALTVQRGLQGDVVVRQLDGAGTGQIKAHRIGPDLPVDGLPGEQQCVAQQVLRRLNGIVRLQKCRADNRAELFGHEQAHIDPGPVSVAIADGDVGLPGGNVRAAQGGIEFEADIGVQRLKTVQARDKPVGGKGGQQADADVAAPAPAAQVCGGGGDEAECIGGAGAIVLALRCQGDAARLADKQRQAEKLFQLADMMADGTLRDEQFLARPAETHQPRDGLEGSKCLQRRQGGGGAHFASCFRLRVISLSGFPDISQIDQ